MQNEKLVEKIKVLADKKGCKPGQLALAWVQQQGDDVFPIPGTKNIKYLEENIAAFYVKLSKQEMTELEEAVPHSAVSLVIHRLNVTAPKAPPGPHPGYPKWLMPLAYGQRL